MAGVTGTPAAAGTVDLLPECEEALMTGEPSGSVLGPAGARRASGARGLIFQGTQSGKGIARGVTTGSAAPGHGTL